MRAKATLRASLLAFAYGVSLQGWAAISGSVFQDYNGNGLLDTAGTAGATATDRGIGAVTVTAYGVANTVCGTATSATTGAVGSYSLTLASTTGNCAGPNYRVEFTGLPATYRPGGRSADSVGSGVANAAGSSSQFAPDGATQVNLAVNVPCDYCENNPTLVTSRHVGNGTNDITAALSFPFNAGISPPATPNGTAELVPTTYGLAFRSQDVGSLWGSSFARQKRTVFFAAFQKRHAAYAKTTADPQGLNGSGRIYFAQKPSAAVGPATVTTPNLLVDLEALFPGSTKPAGDNHDPSAAWDNDNPAFGRVGRVGFGDVAVSRDESTLYVVSMNDKRIYRVPLSSPVTQVTAAASISSVDILALAGATVGGCPAASLIPGAININRYTGQIYFGLTCVAQGPGGVNDSSLLRSFVYRWDGTAATATQVANFPLNYTRQNVSISGAVAGSANWLPWSDNQADILTFAPFNQRYRPQPWLMNIDFDESQNMILGFIDRAGHQLGNDKGGASVGIVEGVSGGDTLRLAQSTTTPGTWNAPPAAEFYTGDAYAGTHQEITLGGLAFVPGADQVVSGAFDPVDAFNSNFRSGGVIWLSNVNGAKTRQYMVFGTDAPSSYGKAAGIGDIELLCDPAPIEIGNRVWRDANGNGIQDPNETPIAGVTVQLVDAASGTVVGTATTDANGEYYFNASNVPDGDVASAGAQPGIRANTNYIVRIPNASGASQQAALASTVASPANSSGDGVAGSGVSTNDPIGDVRDSDGSRNGTNVDIAYNSGEAGNNNHGLDFGFTPSFSLGNRLWFDTNNNGLIDAGEQGTPGVLVELLNATGQKLYRTPGGDLTTTAAGNTAVEVTTDAAGYYRFDGLPPNGYVVSIPAGNWGTGSPLAGYQSSTTTEADPNGNVDSNDNGVQPATAAAYTTAGVRSGVITLGPASDEPTNDTDRPASYGAGSTTGTDAADNQSNLSVDFGFYRLSVGNLIWRDDGTGGGVVNNGTRDGTEPGIAGVTVELLDSGGNVVAVTTTDANGAYTFTQQTAGGTSTGTAGAPLLPGNYLVRVPGSQATLNNLASSADPASGTTPLSSDGDDNGGGTNPATGATTTATFALAAGTNAATGAVGANASGTTDQPRVDLGFAPIPTFSLGNRVFLDPNNNGRQDAGESGIPSATVVLRDSTGAQLYRTPGGAVTTVATGNTAITATTDANGYYRFDGLPTSAAGYVVGVVATSLPAGVASSTGTQTGDQGDKGADTAVGGEFRSAPVPVGTGLQPTGETDIAAAGAGAQGPGGDASTNSTIDFGFVSPTFSIGNRVFLDPNNNGRQDAGENGVAGATVVLRDSTGAQLYRTPGGAVTTVAAGNTAITTATDANGYYRFDGLPASATGYVVGVVAASLPAGVTSSTGTQTGDQGDKGADAAVGGEFRSGPVTLGAGLQPTGEPDIAASGAGAHGPSGDVGTNSTIDFGFVAPNFSIGNRIFSDPNNNGRQDAGEPGLPAVQVRLLDSAGVPVAGVATQTTDANGYYRFDNLPAGTYIVEVIGTTLPAGATSSTGTQTGDQGDKGQDAAVAGNFRSAPVQVGAGLQPTGETDIAASGAGAQGPGGDANTNSTVDFGFVPPTYSIGNRVWADVNNDGLRAAAGEPGIDGVVMSVYAADAGGNPTGPVLATTTTANGGYYRFDNLAAGDYVVLVDPVNFTNGQPLRSFQSSVTTEATPNTDADNNDNGVNNPNPATTGIRSGRITLGPGTTEPAGETDLVAGPNPQGPSPDNQANMTVDFGFYPLASLGDRVFLDTNGNGVQDAGETGVPGVVVRLLDATGNPVLDPVTGVAITTTTDSSGNYLFTNLPAGSYQVEFVVPGGYSISPRDQGANDATDSDVDPATRRTPVVTLGPGESNTTLDAGLFFTASLGDRVWHDLNKNGIQDAGEPGVPGVTVTLTNSVTGTVFGTATTDATGNYSFTGLIPGVPYVATFSTLPSGYQFTPRGPGGSTSDPADSDADPATGRTDPITLVSGQNDPNWDAGIFGPIDLMLDKAAAPVLPATGSPYLTGDQIQFTLTLVNNGPATAVAGYTVTDLLPAGFTSPAIISSAGFAPCAFAGQTLSCTGTNNLAAGAANALTITYRATIGAAAGTLKNIAYADRAAADPSVETIPLGTVPTPATNASSSATNNDADVSIVVNATTFSLGNRVWVDTNNNGVIDAGESGRDGVTVELIDVATNTVISSAMTAGGGYYRFDSLPAGDYIVQIAAANFAAGGALTGFTSSTPTEANPNADADSNDNGVNTPVGGAIRSGVVTLGPTATEPAGEADVAFPNPAGESPDARSNLTVDFGFVPPASLGNVVFRDTNGNGIQDAGETGVPGVTVTLYDGAGNPIAGVPPQVTDGSGNYLFTNLPPGTYTVGFSNLPVNTGLSPANVGANDAVDSDADPATGRTGSVTLAPGETNLTVDAGIVTLAGVSIGNFVWRDNNGNGIQDAGEPGVAGVTATVARVGGGPVVDPSGNPVTTTTVTDANGAYQFTNLAPGAYTVTFSTLPAGFTPTVTNAPGSTPANDSNGLVATSGVLTSGQSDQTLDLGLIPPAAPTFSIGNRVFLDPNNNGRQDTGESGISGATVNLRDSTGAQLYRTPGGAVTTVAAGNTAITATTDASGYYRFDGLPDSATGYVVGVVASTLPAGVTSSTGTQTGDQGDKGGDAAVAGEFRSAAVPLGTGLQPTGEADITASGAGAQGPSGDAGTNSTIDFGFVAPAATGSISGNIFADINRDGTRNPTEVGVPAGTTVQLVDPVTGTVIATAVTDASGNYSFPSVPPGNYNIVVPAGPAGTTPTTPTTVPVTATAGTNTAAPNIGFGPGAYSIGNRVFLDANNDGIRAGAGEPGLDGVAMTIYAADASGNPTGAPLGTITTASGGYYRFDNLAAGDYVVVVDATNFATGGLLRSYQSSVPTEANANSDVDNDDNGVNNLNPASTGIRSGRITVGPGSSEPINEADLVGGAAAGNGPANGGADNTGNMTIDFGFYPLATLGDRVFLDTNGNGIQDAGEGGVPGVTVRLLDGAGNPVLDPVTGQPITTTTDASGNYAFANLPTGSYQVEFVVPAGYAISPRDQGGNDAIDSDIDPVTRRGPVVPLGPGETNNTVDAGLLFNASLGDRVWHDLNKNGVQDAGEPGVAGVTVTLLNNTTGATVATATTDGSGNYSFTGLTPGVAYAVQFTNLPAGYQFTTQGSGGSVSDPGDSDVAPATGRTAPITLVSGQNDPNWDAGIFGPIDFVLDKSAAPVAPATGSPYLTGDTIEFTLTVTNSGPATALAGYTVTDLVPAGLGSPTVTASAGFAPCAFGGQTLTCTGTNNLAAGAGNALTIRYRATITAASGSIKNIAYVTPAAADASVETSSLGVPPTPATNASASATNNDADVTVLVNATTYSLGNRVWIDTNNNGVIDAGETGRDGVTVELIDSATNTVVSSTVTAGGGYYRFDSLAAGDYLVQIAASNFATGGPLVGFTSSGPTETTPNSDADSNDNGLNAPVAGAIRSGVVTVGPGASEPTTEADRASPNPAGEAPNDRSNLTVDFGFAPPASLGNRVFNDTNGNGVQDAGEAGVPGVTVTLYDGAGNPIAGVPPQITDANGNYLFTNLPPGTYTVGFTNLPAGTVLSPADQGGNDTTDSDANPATGRTGPVTLAAGETNLTVDAGVTPQAGVTVGDFVWRDNNSNGIQDASEPGVAGVTVTIGRVGGGVVTDVLGNPVPTTTTTDANGNYTFANLAPGQYTITFSNLPAGFTPTTTNASGSTPANDSNGLTTTSLVLTAGQSDRTLDLGLIPPATPTFSIGNRVFSDPNNNGRQDAGELGLTGVQVRLLDSAGAPVAGVPAQTTDANGYYRFDNLPAGTYIVEVIGATLPAGATSSTGTQTGDQGDKGQDAAVAGNFRSAPVQVGTGLQPTGETDIAASGAGAQGPSGDANTNSTIDFGFVPAPATATVTGTVFSDPNRDGTLNPGEGGVPAGTVVQLVNPTTGVIVATTTSGVNGNYTFTNVVPGPYNVVVPTPPSGTTPTTPTTVPVTATAGTTTTASNIGFGPVPSSTATVTGTVFTDPNRDGTRNPGESGVPAGTLVQLVNPVTGVVVATTTTDANGNYSFANVVPGNYNVVIPAGPAGSSPTTPISVPVTATSGTSTAAPNVGFGPANGTGTISGTVFTDPNRDGSKSPTETGVPAGTVVQLIGPTGAVIATTTTNADGTYTFVNIPPGTYSVVVPTAPGGTTPTTPTRVPVSSVANAATTAPNIGFGPGVATAATVTGTVFIDPNANGTREPTELGAGGVVVSLLNASGTVVATTTTDANGNYTFPNVPPGTFTAVVSVPPANTATTPVIQTITVPTAGTVTAANVGLGTLLGGAAAIPTMSEWGMIIMSLLLMMFGARRLKRRVV